MRKITRQDAIDKLQVLAEGKGDPVEIAQWAEQIEYPENSEYLSQLQNDDPLLVEILGNLSLAGAINEKNELLYGVSDFQTWLEQAQAAKK